MRRMKAAGGGAIAVAALCIAGGAFAHEQTASWAQVFHGLRPQAAAVDVGPFAEVRLTLAAPLADTDPPRAAIAPAQPRIGDSMQFDLRSPGFASYVYAAYFGADGTVLVLAQPSSTALRPKPPHTELKFGDAQPDSPGFIVQAPVGSELLLVLAAEKPLFDQALPTIEGGRDFLAALRQAVASADAGRIAATLLPVTTAE